MIKNIIKVTFRNIFRHKVYSFINIIGLATGMACCFLILLWVANELSYDRYHKKADSIYRLCTDLKIGGTQRKAPMTSPLMATTLLEEFPEVLNAVRITPQSRTHVQYKDLGFYEDLVRYADSSFFQVFTHRMIQGNPQTALVAPYTAVLTEDIASKYFGNADPLGKTIRLDGASDFTVTGVIENVPENSHFDFNILCSFQTLYAENRPGLNVWGHLAYYTYLLLSDNTNYENLQTKIAELVEARYGERFKALGASLNLFLQPLRRIYLHSNLQSEIAPLGNISNVYLFSGIAVFILLIACFNFINLTTAQSVKRSKEVGIRKTFGAPRGKIIFQFLVESSIFSGISIVVTLILLEIAIPWFKDLTGMNIAADDLKLSRLAAGFLGVFVFVSLFAGIYPALFLASFKPIAILKTGLYSNLTKSRLRNLLVVVQFAITIALIAGSMAIYKQIDYMKNKKLGFNKEHVMALQNIQVPPELTLTSIKEQFLGIAGVENVSLSTGVPGGNSSMINFLPEGRNEDETETMLVMDVDDSYISTFGLELAAGRGFSREFATDDSQSAIINEAAAKLLGWENPVGKTIKRRGTGPDGPFWASNTIIGVIKDFHLYSLHSQIEPLYFGNTGANFNTISIKIASENISRTVGLLEKSWNEMMPEKPFDYVFIDQTFDSMYESEENTARVAASFCFLAIFIASLGLFGLSSFTSEQRTKEIGIRKTLGASVSNIIRLISKEYVYLTLLANIIAWPAAYYFITKWLENFAYREPLSPYLFVISGVLALLITSLTVSFQSVRAALTNAVETLRHE